MGRRPAWSPRTTDDIDLSFIVVNYKTDEETAVCVRSLAAFASDVASEIIVVDNTPGAAVEMPIASPVRVRRIVNHKNLGYGSACNVGLAAARGKYIFFLNPDVTYESGSAREIVCWMDEHPKIGAVGPTIIHPNGARQFSCRGFPGLSTALYGSSSLLTRYFPGNPWTRRYLRCDLNGSIADVDWISGCCLLARQEAMSQIGGFDPSYFLFFEDVDLCRRLQLAGWKRVYHPEIRFMHEIGASRKHLAGRGWSYHYLSAGRYFRKYAFRNSSLPGRLCTAAAECARTHAAVRPTVEAAIEL